MLICFEGPKCSGKTTMINRVADELNKYKNLKSVRTIKFPNKFPIQNQAYNNPYYFAFSFLTDFYETIYGDGDLISAIKSPFDIVIFDRYYYSTMILSSIYKESGILKEPKNEDQIKEEQKDLTALVLDLPKKMKLPAPDLNLVLFTDEDTAIERMIKREGHSEFLNNKEDLILAYRSYKYACSSGAIVNIFGRNGESLPPVMIADSNVSLPVAPDDSFVVNFNRIASTKTKLSEDQVFTNIMNVIISFFQHYSATYALTERGNSELEYHLKNPKNKKILDLFLKYYNMDSVTDILKHLKAADKDFLEDNPFFPVYIKPCEVYKDETNGNLKIDVHEQTGGC